MMIAIVCGMTISVIREGGFWKPEEDWNVIVFQIIVGILMPIFLLFLGLIFGQRLKYSFTEIQMDDSEKKLIYKKRHIKEEINYADIESTVDKPNKGLLIISDRFTTINIPREICNYSYLYSKLTEKGLIKENINFNNFRTTLGLMFWVYGTGLLIISLIPFALLPDLIRNDYGSSNTIAGMVLLPLLGVIMLLMLLRLANKYLFTDSAIIKINPLYKKQIDYSNIESLDYNAARKCLTINLINDKYKWLRKLNGETGIVMMEPGNISIEKVYLELEKRKNYMQHHV
jgi:hypothetical protein